MDEADVLKNLKQLEREAATRVKELRAKKKVTPPKMFHGGVMRQFLQSRKLVGKNTPNELILIDRTLDRDDLTTNERKALKFRRKKVLSRLTLEEK